MSFAGPNASEIEKVKRILDGVEEKYLLGEIDKAQRDELFKKYDARLQELLRDEEAFRMRAFTKDVYLRQIKANLELKKENKVVEEDWSKIRSSELYGIVPLTVQDFKEKIRVLSVERPKCQVFIDLEEKIVWVKEYGKDNKVFYTRAPFKIGAIS